MSKHLLFYDGSCGFCDHTVQLLLKVDHKKLFVFAPLQGKTASEVLKELPEASRGEDSLVLVENYQEEGRQFYILGKGAFRIFWLLGGGWRLLGWISFLPTFLYDWGYRIVARHRHRFFGEDACELPNPQFKDRFLP